MRWKLKAKIQNAISVLPSAPSYAAYYWLQRKIGGLKRSKPINTFSAAINIWKIIQEQGIDPAGKVFFEVGTGRIPDLAIAFWLMGAEKIITVDVNPYLKAELIDESIQYIFKNNEAILSLFGSLMNTKRLEELQEFHRIPHFSISGFFDLCRVEYMAPADAADTSLSDQSIDFHTSKTVFEHIPIEVLKLIMEEGNRIIKNNGLFIHSIDYGDHYSYSDKNISRINFLQYSDEEWAKYNSNKYMYMNRLRHDDYINLFESVGHQILKVQEKEKNQPSIDLLNKSGLHLDDKFRSKSIEILTMTGSFIVSQKNDS